MVGGELTEFDTPVFCEAHVMPGSPELEQLRVYQPHCVL
jgi:hypothetical protein